MIKIIEGVLQQQKNCTNTNSHLHYVSDTNVLVQRFLCNLQTISVGGTAFVFGGMGEEMGKIQECLNYKTKGLASSVMWGTLLHAEYCLKYLTSSTMCKYKGNTVLYKIKHR